MDSLVPGFSLSMKFLPLLDAWAGTIPGPYGEPVPYGEEASFFFFFSRPCCVDLFFLGTENLRQTKSRQTGRIYRT